MEEKQLSSQADQLIKILIRLSDNPVLFLGLAKLINVNLLTDNIDDDGHPTAKEAEQLFIEIISNFEQLPRKRRKEIVKIASRALKEKILIRRQ